MHSYLIHSEVRNDWGFVGKWICVSPNAHAVHHSLAQPHWDKNFAFLSPIWDHLFGTYYSGKIGVKEIGTDEIYYNHHPLPSEMLWGVESSFRKLRLFLWSKVDKYKIRSKA